MYRLTLTDKGNAGYSIDRPGDFLSPKAIERRQKQGFAVNETDLPIDPSYFAQLENLGAKVYTYSKWVSTIVVAVEDEGLLPAIRNLAFVKETEPVWKGILPNRAPASDPQPEVVSKTASGDKVFSQEDYGFSFVQNSLFNLLPLHQEGYTGEGIAIAVIDGGYYGTNRVPQFDQERIKETRNFTHEQEDLYESSLDHGTRALSCMLANSQGEIIGTAPYADYYLFKSEVNAGEYPIEEDYWVAAVEYADSIGIDVVSTSLGYALFDDSSMDHTHAQLDGQAVPASRAASMLASKGMILCHSAGNSGNSTWEKILIASDATDILTVGSVNSSREVSASSGRGYTADNRVKPDVMAMGSKVYVVNTSGIMTSSGTSFSCPLTAGAVACLWQALPNLNSLAIMDIIRRSTDRFENPNKDYGYGIPDFHQAWEIGKDYVSTPVVKEQNCLRVDFNHNKIYVSNTCCDRDNAVLSVYTPMGTKVLSYSSAPSTVDFGGLAPGLYVVLLQWDGNRVAEKFIRR